jgi:hypothetical protein
MPKYYFQAATVSLFMDHLHGPREILIDDPAFDPKKAAKGVVAKKVSAPNPNCKLPEDAVEITQARHTELMDGQAAGKQIVAGDDGLPKLIDRPGPTPDQVKVGMIAQRNQALKDSDYTQFEDSPLDAVGKTAWARYRRALRDYPASVADWSNPPPLPKAPK